MPTKKGLMNVKKCQEYGRETARSVAGAMQAIGTASKLTMMEMAHYKPSRIDKMEVRLLKMLAGWSAGEMQELAGRIHTASG